MNVLAIVAVIPLALSQAGFQDRSALQEFAVEIQTVPEQAGDLPTRSISLAEALDRALAENIEFALARGEEQLARSRRFTARSTLYPGLEMGIAARRIDGRVQGSFGFLRDTTFSTYVGGAALVYRANIGARLKQALAENRNLEAAQLDSLAAEQRLLLRVFELYQDLLFTTVSVQIAQGVVEGREEFFQIVQARTQGGLGLGVDMARADAKLAADQQQLIQARNMLIDTSTRLAVLLRLDSDILLVPEEDRLKPAHYYLPPEIVLDDGAGGRPDIQAVHKRAEAAQLSSSAAKWDLFAPELRAEITEIEIGDTTNELEDQSQRRGLILWTFSPVDFGVTRQRRAEENLARLRLVEAEDRARAEIRRAKEGLKAARDRIPLAGRGLDAARDTLRLSEARFKAGTAISLEVLHAQNLLAEARFNLTRAIVEYNSAQARMLAATGAIDRAVFEPTKATSP